MKTFKDTAGREWTIEINVAALKRVRSLTGVDLLGVLDGSLIEKLIQDPVLLCDVVYAAVKPQADERNVADEDFGRAMAGDAIEDATTALLDELVSFCPSPRDRANLGRILAATRTVMDKARDMVEAKLDSGELERLAEQTIREAADERTVTAGGSSTSAPASSASIQPP